MDVDNSQPDQPVASIAQASYLHLPPFQLMWLSQVANDARIMKTWTNARWTNALVAIVAVLVTLATLALFVPA